eukprot:PhF_6_TR37728/c0_g1_i1/m.56166
MSTGHNQSGTAELVAHYRSICTKDSKLKILCYDPWAQYFVTSSTLTDTLRSSGALPDMEIWVAARTAFLDATVVDAVQFCNIRQVVILGAGFDTRSNRLGLHHRAAFFEIDAPGPQQRKLKVIDELVKTKGYIKEAATYISCDFETQNFMDCLLGSSAFDASAPTLFVIEGVVYYLTKESVEGIFSSIRAKAQPSSIVVFDFFFKSKCTWEISAGSKRSEGAARRA